MLRGLWVLVALSVGVGAWAGTCPPGTHPMVEASYGKAPVANLLGATVDGAWQQPAECWTLVRGGERYQLYSPFKKLGTATGAAAVSTPESPASAAPAVTLEVSKAVRESAQAIIGICGDWNALPRVPKVQSTAQPAYRQIVRALLDANGMPTVPVHIARIWRVDLEGDGTHEVLIEAGAPTMTYEDDPKNYSLVLLRKIINGTVRTITLHAYYGRAGGLATREQLRAVLDVNGDGRLEIITAWAWHDGHGATVTAITDGQPRVVLHSGYGL